MQLSEEELNLVRQWFNALQNTYPRYLEQPDYALALKIYRQLGVQVPSSFLNQDA